MKNKKKSSEIPTSLSSILGSNSDAMDYYSNMDKASRDELIHYANDFKSSEDLEQYIYYSMKDTFK